MAGTREGGLKARETNKSKFGESYYVRIGTMGGATPTTKKKGFAARPELASSAGRLGGLKGRRGKKVNE